MSREKRGKSDKKPYQKARKSNSGFKKGGKKPQSSPKKDDGLMRLNKFIANAGICSRREADKLIEAGVIKVNGEVVTELGHKVSITDVVHCEEQKLSHKKLVYFLFNKSKNLITSSDDPKGRLTVLDVMRSATKESIFPVGRLDRNTTGLLLLTNDGELSQKLTHPKNQITKVYHVQTDKNVKGEHLELIKKGLELEDGLIKADEVSYVRAGRDGKVDKKQVGIEIHSGRNRIVRRIFEHLGYKVLKLDRVLLANLTKKDLPRGKWRELSENELNFLKML